MDESMKGAFRRLRPAIFNSFTDHCSPPLTVPLRSDQLEYGSSTGPRVDKDGRGGLKTEHYLNVSDEEDDDGYFSMFHKREHWTDEVREPWDVCHPESSSGQAAISSRHISFTHSDLGPTVSGPQLESLEGDSEEGWTIGPPMFESSLCHSVTVKLSAGSEQSRKVTEELQHGVTEPVYDCQATVRRDTATVQSPDTSYEATLSPQVKVKSVVVALRQSTTSSRSTSSSSTSRSNTTAPSVLELKDFHSNRSVLSGKRKRLEDLGVDWECKKQSYVRSVTKHMEEHPTTQGTTRDALEM
ncbi:uncharacterized protein LOC133961386 isoform X2 [Platichthys flesus]|uniref:uncharacterized protein LOC133961386 isoform X2 n=1 Tax=Platichthys flesus TaxID=8260 RepID=UPI002DBB404C|nr:uncharacterized protein LOC133961386 isoform X2 [Platichthys flesus]